MSRLIIRKVFLTGLVFAVAGAVVLAVSIQEGAATSSHRYEAGMLLAGIGGLMTLVSWIMALAASALLGRWGWFAVVLILGLIGLVLPLMVVYSVLGPVRRRGGRDVVATGTAQAQAEGQGRLTPA